jgi:uncharacterized membrane protein
MFIPTVAMIPLLSHCHGYNKTSKLYVLIVVIISLLSGSHYFLTDKEAISKNLLIFEVMHVEATLKIFLRLSHLEGHA